MSTKFFSLVFFYNVDLLKQDGTEGERTWCSASHGKMLLASALCKYSLNLSGVPPSFPISPDLGFLFHLQFLCLEQGGRI